MSKVRLVYKADGSVAVIRPAMKAKLPDETEDEFYLRIFDKICKANDLEGLDFADVDPATLPDRSDRNYWTKKGQSGVKVDTAKKKQDSDAKKAKKDAVKAKLGLTDDELEDLKKVLKNA